MKNTHKSTKRPLLLSIIQILNYFVVIGGIFLAIILLFSSESTLQEIYPSLNTENRYLLALSWLTSAALYAFSLYKIRVRDHLAPETLAIVSLLNYPLLNTIYFLDGEERHVAINSIGELVVIGLVAYILLNKGVRAYLNK